MTQHINSANLWDGMHGGFRLNHRFLGALCQGEGTIYSQLVPVPIGTLHEFFTQFEEGVRILHDILNLRFLEKSDAFVKVPRRFLIGSLPQNWKTPFYLTVN